MLDTSYCDCLKTLLPPILCLKAANVQSLPPLSYFLQRVSGLTWDSLTLLE